MADELCSAQRVQYVVQGTRNNDNSKLVVSRLKD